MPDNLYDGTWVGQGLQIPGNQTFVSGSLGNTDKIQGSEADPLERLKDKAEWQALEDVEVICGFILSGAFITINQANADTRIRRLARGTIQQIYRKPPLNSEWSDLHAEYKDAYQRRFDEAIQSNMDHIEALPTYHEVNIRNSAMQDRKDIPLEQPNQIRDLAVIRVLDELALGTHAAPSHLKDIHHLTDSYQRYYINPREGVEWPDPSFRS